MTLWSRKRSSWRDLRSGEPPFLKLKKSTPKNKNKKKILAPTPVKFDGSLSRVYSSDRKWEGILVISGYTNPLISSCPCYIPVIQHMHPNDIPISQGSTWCRRLAAKGYTELGPLLLSPATKSLQSTKDNSRIIWRHCGGSVVPLLFWVLLEVEVDDVHVSQSDLVMTGDTTGFYAPEVLGGYLLSRVYSPIHSWVQSFLLFS